MYSDSSSILTFLCFVVGFSRLNLQFDFFYFIFMTNIVAWNCRGARAQSFPSLVRDLKVRFNIHILFIVEPRVSGERAKRVISRLGFSKDYRVEAEEFSRGIWILWDANLFNIDILSTSSQCIHTFISFSDGTERFFLTCVYGSPVPSMRQNLWKFLEVIKDSIQNMKWLCMGDFNAYNRIDDKQRMLILMIKQCLISIIAVLIVIS